MKNIFTLLALFVFASANARETGEQMTTVGPGLTNGGFPHFTPIEGGDRINNKVSLRLVAKTYLGFNGSMFIPKDSNTYSYSNDRGGVPDVDEPSKDENILFDHSNTYVFDVPFGYYKPARHRAQTFTVENRILSLVYSSWKTSGSTWKDSARYLYGYSNGKMTSSALELWYGNLWTNSQSSTIEYNGDKVSKMNSDLYRVEFTYDGNNNLVLMTDSELTPAGWQNKERKSYEYAGKDVTKYTLEVWDAIAGSWVFFKQWQYQYTGLDVTTETEYHWSGWWAAYGIHDYTYDGSHNKLTDAWQIWNNGFQNETLEEWTYNSQNLPEKMTTKTWNGSSWACSTKDYEYHFYYENYFPSSIKADAVLAGLNVNTYPNPATNELHIDLGIEKAADFDFSIIGMNGSVVTRWNEHVTRDYSKAIQVSHLPAGNYFIRVSNDNQQLTKQFVVSR